jgi:hypothetical protein
MNEWICWTYSSEEGQGRIESATNFLARRSADGLRDTYIINSLSKNRKDNVRKTFGISKKPREIERKCVPPIIVITVTKSTTNNLPSTTSRVNFFYFPRIFAREISLSQTIIEWQKRRNLPLIHYLFLSSVRHIHGDSGGETNGIESELIWKDEISFLFLPARDDSILEE